MDTFEALAHPHRRRLLELLADGERGAGELASDFGTSRPAISWQLRTLLEAGLVQVRQDGRRRVYSLAPDELAVAETWLRDRRVTWEQRLDALEIQVRRRRRRTGEEA